MVSKNNWQYQQQRQAQRVPHYGLRKLSVGVASVLLSTTLYMGVSAHADTVVTPGETTTPATTTVTTPSPSADKATSETAGSGANATSTDPTSEMPTSQATPSSAGTTSEKPVDSVAGAKGVSETADSKVGGGTPVNDGQAANPQSTVNRLANTTGTTTTTVASDATRKTTLNTTVTWTIHYVDETGNHLQPDSVVSHDYARTDIGDQMGNWSYVPNSVKVTGTPNAGSHIDNPDFKFDQIDGKTTFDYASWYAAAASIDGYTPDYSSVVIIDQLPKNPEGLHATTIIDSGKHEYTFVYTQRPKTVTINYVNDDDNENVVKTDSVNGKPNTEVTITPNLPSGYMLTPGKDVPSKYTVTDGDNQALTIHVQKQFVDVSDTDPQAKQTRTITLHYVYDGGSKDGQKAFDDAVLDVYYHRTATFDRSTNQTTYGDWTWDNSQGDTSTPGYHVVSGKWTNLPQSWANVTADVPNIKGYHADLGQNDPTNTNHVPANTWVFPTYNNRAGAGVSDSNKGATAYLDGYGYEVSPTHTIKYVPNQTTVTVNYVDDDNNKANVGSQHWDGTIGQHIDLTLTPPTNYVLSPGWANPTSYDFDGVNSSWFTVHVKHATQDVTATQPSDQVNKTETLTRKHLYGPGPHEGEKFGEPDILEVPWHRAATKDLVTNKVSFGDWHVIWDEVKQLSGATKMWGDSEHHWVNGGLIAGHSGYSYLGVGAKTEAITTDGTVSGHGWYWMGEQDIENNPTIVQYYGREKVGVPVNYVDFDTNQQLGTKRLTGDDYLDGNTITINKGDLTDWGTIINKKYQLYAGQTLPTTYKIDTVSNNGNLTPITVYVVQPRTVQFTFADNDSTVNAQHPQVGDAVSVTGITGSTTSVNLTIPAGYKLVEGQQLPTTYTFVKGEQNQVILLTHQHVTVQPDAPKTTTDALPDNPGKNYPSGVAKDDLSKTVTRKVTITSPDGKSTVTNQTVTFTRNATVDEVTGNVTYGSWSENGKHEFATVNVPNVSGYTATGDVPSLTVTPDSKDINVTINYTANDQTTQVVFVDDDDEGRTVGYKDIHGKTGETQKLTDLPKNYEFANGQSDTITFSPNMPAETTVHLKHKIETKQLKINAYLNLLRLIKHNYNVSEDKEGNYLLWINNDEFNSGEYEGNYKNIGSVTGSVQYDLVSGEVVKVNNGETFKFGKILLNYPSDDDIATSGSLIGPGGRLGHTFTQWMNDELKDNLSYKAYASANLTKVLLANKELLSHDMNDVAILVPFTFENGKQYGPDNEIDTSTIDNSSSINFNDLVKNNSQDIDMDDDGSLSTDIDLFMPIVYQPYISKTVTRTINVTSPDKTVKTVKQTAEINQDVGIDRNDSLQAHLHKGNAYVTDSNWSAYEVPDIPGYTASQSQVNEVAVDGNTTDQTVNISYTANKQQININYVDVNDGNKVVHTIIVNGVTDGDATVTNELPTGYKLVDGQSVPKTVHFNANNDDINIKVQHSTVTVTPDSPKTPSDKLPDNPGKSYPSGVSENDLNKTVTRTIKVTQPDGTVTNKVQTVKLTRTAMVDEVTGEVTYGKWSTGQWDAYEIPALKGYTASQTSVETTPVSEDTKDQTVEISYTPNKQSTTIKYVDSKGQVAHTTAVNGVTDQRVKVPNEVPAGWVITKGEVPSEITFSVDGHEPIEVTIDHRHITVTPDQPQNNGTKLPDNSTKTFNGVEANDLNKTITRTVKVTTPDGKTTTTKQIVKLTRTADVDEVTGEVAYGNWTTGEWAAYDAPSVVGYTPSQTAVAKESVTAISNDTTVEITYQPIQHQISVEYVDDDDHGKIVKTDRVPGKTDQTITVTPSAPVNYDLVDNGNRTYAVTSDAVQTVQIHVKHHQITTSESKTVTRTINVHTPHDGTKVVKQTAKLTWDVTTDQVTGKKTYGDWSAAEWDRYAVPAVAGYVPSIEQVSQQVVNDTTTDQTIDVTYSSGEHTTHINYVDGDGNIVHTTTIKGQTDGTAQVPNETPAGWTVVGEPVPTELAFGPDGHADVTVTVDHQHVTVTPDQPQNNGTKLPDNPVKTFEGVEANDLNKTITRTIKVTTPDGQTKTVAQTAKLTRNADVDEVTGKVTYGKWTTGQWDSYEIPALKGYTASQTSVEATPVDENTKDQTVEVNYTPNKQSTTIKYVDDKGQTIHTTIVDGITDQTVEVPNEVPAGWVITKGKVPSEITFGADGHEPVVITVDHRHITVTPDQPQNNGTKLPDNPAKTFSGVEANDLNKTITRTIKLTTPDGQIKTVAQTAKLTRIADVDEVTGEVKYGAWTTGQWDSYETPALKGYTASQTNVEATPVDENTKDQTVDINYTANSQTTHINYVDDAGKTVHTTTITGKTGETVKVPNEVPAGWVITKGEVPSEISFGPNGYADETITIGHQHVTVDPDHPQNNGTKLPDNPAKAFNGVETNDLNKTITRTIKVTTPDGKSTTTKQTVKLTRTADVDEVTGEVTYGKWTTGQWNAYEVPALNGYTASQTSVEATPVDENTKDQTVEVSYTPNKQSTTIKYVDDKGQVVHTTTVNGVTNQTVKVPSEVPAGWMITKGEVPSELTFGVDGHEPIEVTVDHQHVTVDPDHPQNNGTKLPDNPAKTFNGVEVDDLNKTITRTIEVTTPDGKSTTTKQTVKLTRTADVDEVTGEVTYGNWTTGQWDAYEVSALKGYTASQTSVETTPVDENTKNQTVEVSYTPNKQSTTIKYVDDKGQTIHTTTVNGLTDQKVKVPNEVPAGWMITKGEVPSELIFSADGHEPVVIMVVHQHVTVDPDHPQNNGTKLPDNPAKTFEGVEANNLNKIITRTIKLTTPDGKVTATKQTVKLTRTADVDEVTGEVTYGNWTTGEWTAYNAPSVAGYTPSQTAVAKESVTATSNDTTVEITYQPMQHQISVEYVDDDDHGKVVETDQVPGKTDQTITVTPSAPANYDLVDNGSRTYTVTSDDAQAVQIHVKHHQVTTSESKTVTRTVNVHTPHDGAKVVKQTAELTRDVTTDQVTGNKTYGDWTTGQWESYTPEAIPGYTSSTNEVLKTNVDGNSKNQMVDVTYTADAQKVEIVYVDDAKGDAVVKTDQIDGKTDETVKVTPAVPTGYELVGKVPSDYTMTADGHQTITVHLVHQTKISSESKTVTRTINVHTPHDGAKVVKQTAELTRNVTTDQVTGNKTYGDWSTTEWDRYVVPAVAGYVPSIEQVAQQVVNGTTTDQTIDVIYSSGEHTTHINYVDGDGNIVHTTTIKGQTDGTVQVPNETPAGWTVVGEPVPTELAFGPDGHADVTVTVEHQHVTVTPDQPKTPTDKLPDNPAKTYPNGVGHDDLNKTITRTIKITMPDGQTKTVAQTAKLTRTADVDEVTGEVTYGKWATGEWSNYDVPTVPGYTPSQSEVPAQTVSFGDDDVVKTVTYKANTQKLKVVFIDDTTGKTLNTIEKAGLSDTDSGYNTKADISDYAAKHYDLVSDGTNGKNLMFDHDDNTDQHYEVHLTHHKSDTSRQSTVNETIHYVYENSKQAADDYVAKPIVFTQTGVKDLVTGDTDWSGQWTSDQEFKAVDSPEITGYTPSQKTVDAIKVSHDTSDIKRVVTYVANNQVAKITYIDDVTGKVLATDEVSGKFGSRVDYNALARINSFEKQGYQLKTNGFDQPSYQADDTKNQFEIRLIHQLNKTSRESTVTRTISYVDSITGLTLHQPIIQTLKFIEDGVTDLVTNETTWQTASHQQFVSVKVPEIEGYASELSVVEPAEVGFGDANIETTVKYKKLDVTNTISYVDSQGKVIKTDTVSGQSGTEIKLDVPSGYHLVDNQTKVTISENETKQEVMIAKDDVTNTISYVDSQGKVIKTNTVSGQSGTEIKLDVPSGYHLVDNQTKVTISENNSTQTVKITKDNSANKIARHLPQTGNQRETGLVALGLATGLLGLVVLRKKRN